MRLISVEHLQPGMKNALTIYPPGTSSGPALLAKGVEFTEQLRERLERAGVTVVYIDDRLSRGIEPDVVVSDEVRRKAIASVGATFEKLKEPEATFTSVQAERLTVSIDAVVSEIMQHTAFFVSLNDLGAFEPGRVEHSVNVCILGCAIARQYFPVHGWKDFRGVRRMDAIAGRISKLAMGLMLQDIGSLTVPDEIWEKRGLLTAAERQLVYEHPTVGAEMARAAGLSPLVTVAIAQHHERFNGTGYPKAMRGEDLHDHGQIAAIAELYVSMCRARDGKKALEPHDAFMTINRASGKLFKPDIAEAFGRAIAPYGPGKAVILSDGTYGIVEALNPERPLEPLIRVTHNAARQELPEPRELDLSQNRSITIKRAISHLPGDRSSSGAERGRAVAAG